MPTDEIYEIGRKLNSHHRRIRTLEKKADTLTAESLARIEDAIKSAIADLIEWLRSLPGGN